MSRLRIALLVSSALALAALLSACGSGIESQVQRVETFFKFFKVGSSSDYLLVKSGFAGRDPVGVIFGFMDDGEFCNEIAHMYMQRYKADRYYCEKLN